MHKLVLAIATVVLCCGAAWAITDATVTITDKSGQPLDGATVSITRVDKKPAPRPKTPKTDQDGKIAVTYDEKDKDDKGILIITVTTKGGATLVVRTAQNALLTRGTVVVETRPTTARPHTAEPRQTTQPQPNIVSGYETLPLMRSPFSFSLSGGPTWTRYSSKYSGTGNQALFDNTSNATGGELCGGANAYWPIGGGGKFEYGGGVNYCQDFTGQTTLFDIVRHGLTGHVTATAEPGPRFEPYIGFHYQTTPASHIFMRVGPLFAWNRLTINSNQVPGGGQFESASDTFWSVGLGLQGGIAWPLCPNCFFGLPLSGSLGGKFAWYPGSHSVDVRSRVFGFTETATLDHSTQFNVFGSLSVPLGR
jgi:5-hydroxyisourate hydrolase-like protein (transthyretin family)